MDLINAVENMVWYNWGIFFIMVLYIVLWVMKVPMLADPDRRFLRISSLDSFYEMGSIGLVIFHIRNGFILVILFVTFRISMM